MKDMEKNSRKNPTEIHTNTKFSNQKKKNKETFNEKNKTIKCMLKVFNGLNRL